MEEKLIAFAIPVFLVAIGMEWTAARLLGRPVYRLADALTDLGCGIGQQVTTFFTGAAVLGVYAWVYAHARVATLSGAAAWVAALLGVDLVYYWWHRLSHQVNVLWAAHVVHHQSEDYNLAVALRQSVTTAFTSLPFNLSLAVLGVPPVPFAVAGGVSLLYQFWIHTELVPKLGPFELLFNTPSHHRVHHATNPRYLDKNHGGILIAWDRLFGSWVSETEPCVYGLTRPVKSFNPLWVQLAGYAELVRLSLRAPSLVEAVALWFKSPGYWPPWMGEKPSLPPPLREAVVKHEVAPPPLHRWWALAQFALVVPGVFALVMWGATFAPWKAAALGALIVWTLGSVGALLESRRWAWPVEAARLCAAAALALTASASTPS